MYTWHMVKRNTRIAQSGIQFDISVPMRNWCARKRSRETKLFINFIADVPGFIFVFVFVLFLVTHFVLFSGHKNYSVHFCFAFNSHIIKIANVLFFFIFFLFCYCWWHRIFRTIQMRKNWNFLLGLCFHSFEMCTFFLRFITMHETIHNEIFLIIFVLVKVFDIYFERKNKKWQPNYEKENILSLKFLKNKQTNSTVHWLKTTNRNKMKMHGRNNLRSAINIMQNWKRSSMLISQQQIC